jgi:hypothetical protein
MLVSWGKTSNRAKSQFEFKIASMFENHAAWSGKEVDINLVEHSKPQHDL